MGDVIHRAVIVTSWDSVTTQAAWEEANALNLIVTKIGATVTNGYTSFLVCPCGSKEGWDTCDDYLTKLATFIKYLRQTDYIEWCFVEYGSDLLGLEGKPTIICE
jgi:hypothetical protein